MQTQNCVLNYEHMYHFSKICKSIKNIFLFGFIISSHFSSAQVPDSASTATSTENSVITPKIKMIEFWTAQKKTGSQKFIIESESEEVSGIFSWDLDKNYWKFEYNNGLVWEVYDNKVVKTENGEKKTYACMGLSALLKHPVGTWNEVLEFESEETQMYSCILVVKFQKKTMIWKYTKHPFNLLAVGIHDMHDRYYLMNFEVEDLNLSA